MKQDMPQMSTGESLRGLPVVSANALPEKHQMDSASLFRLSSAAPNSTHTT